MDADKYITIGTTLLPFGLAVLVIGGDRHDWFLGIAGGVIALFGVFTLAYAIRKAGEEKEIRYKRDNHLIAVLDAIAKKLGVDVDKVHKEKRGKEN